MNPSSGSSAAEGVKAVDPVALEQCARLLEGETSDEEKFAGLLLVTKMVDPHDRQSLAFLFNRISFSFIRRLLATKTLSSDVPPQLLQTLAMSIVFAFAVDETLSSHENILSLVPIMKDVLLSRFLEPVDDTSQQDILQTLCMVSKSPQGAQQLLLNNLLEVFPAAFRNASLPEDHLLVIFAISQSLYTDRQLVAKHAKSVVALLPPVAGILRQNQGALKFKVVDFVVASLGLLLDMRERSPQLHHEVSGELERASRSAPWANDVRVGIRDILTSKISTAERDPALMTVFLMMTLVGPHWLFVDPSTSSPQPAAAADQGKGVTTNSRFISAVLNLVCVEARVILEDQDPAKLADTNAQKLVVYFEILEMAIHHLSLLAEEKVPTAYTLDTDVILQLKEAMEITFGVVIDFLLPVNDQLNFGDPSFLQNPVVHACVRVLSVWLTEDSEAHTEGAITLLPLFVFVASHPEFGLMDLLVPFFLHLTTQETCREPFVEQGGMSLLVNYLLKTLSPLTSSLTREHVAKVQVTLESLLNIAMMAPDMMKKEVELFKQLFSRLSSFAPAVTADISNAGESSLSLLGTALLLALSIAKSLHEVLTREEADLARLMPDAFFFLKTGLGIKLSRSTDSATIWADISELWFLCLTLLGDCLTLTPTPQTLPLDPLLSLLDSAPPDTFSKEDLQYTTLFRSKLAAILGRQK